MDLSGVPGFLLVNRLVCKPACYLGSSLIEPHKSPCPFSTLCTPECRAWPLSPPESPEIGGHSFCDVLGSCHLVTGMLSKGGCLSQGQWGKVPSQPELSCDRLAAFI